MLNRAVSTGLQYNAPHTLVRRVLSSFGQARHAARVSSPSRPAKRRASPELRTLNNRTTSRLKYAPGKHEKQSRTEGEESETIRRFQNAIESDDLETGYLIYSRGQSFLASPDIISLIKLLERRCRSQIQQQDYNLVAHVNQIAEDLQCRRIVADVRVLEALLRFYDNVAAYEKGIKLWKWSRENLRPITPTTYGHAINLLLNAGASLMELEDLYKTALKEHTGDFIEYHLSPNAILANRQELASNIGASMSLLAAMCKARIYHGDLANAYLDLDTALRLHPADLDGRFLHPFFQDIPLPAAYTVYCLACRMGSMTSLERSSLHTVMKRMTDSWKLNWAKNEYARCSVLTMFKLDVLHATAASISILSAQKPFLRQFFHSLLQSLCMAIQGYQLYEKHAISDIVEVLRKILSLMEMLGGVGGSSLTNLVLTAATKLQSQELFILVYQSPVLPISESYSDKIQQRVLLKAVFALPDKELAQQMWRRIISDQAVDEDPNEIYKTWVSFARAAADGDMIAYFKGQFEERKHTLDESLQDRLLEEIDKKDAAGFDISSPSASQVNQDMRAILQKVGSILHTIESCKIHNFKQNPFQMTMSKPRIAASEQDLRQVYDKMTSDPSQGQPPTPPTGIPITSTGFRVDELRYENWKTVNELLADADATVGQEVVRMDSTSPEMSAVLLSREDLEREIVRLRSPAPHSGHSLHARKRYYAEQEHVQILDR